MTASQSVREADDLVAAHAFIRAMRPIPTHDTCHWSREKVAAVRAVTEWFTVLDDMVFDGALQGTVPDDPDEPQVEMAL